MTHPEPTVKASDVFAASLAAEGVTCVFGLPGEENLDLLESLRRAGIRVVVTRHEQAAGFMAATWGRLDGRAGVALATLGPGATNLVTAAAYAQLGAMPAIMITGQKPIRAPKQGHFQIVDVVEMMRPLTKSARTIVSADAVPARVREAFRVAEEERPGAVHLELPEDVAREAASAASAKPMAAARGRRPIADEQSIARAAAALNAAERPLLVIGAGANRKLTSEMLRAFVDRAGLPFVTTQMGKGVVDERHPLWLGTAQVSSGDVVHRAIDGADCVLVVGHDVVEKPPFFMRAGETRTVIHLNFSSAAVDPVYFPQIEVVGDIANAVWRLTEALAPQGPAAPRDNAFFERVRAELAGGLARGADDDRFPLGPERVVAEVRRAMPEDGIVCLDNGLYKLAFARGYRAAKPNTLLLDNALATMGAGLPSAIAAKLARPRQKVLAVAGDGGFLMSGQELETAVRLGINLVVAVLVDGGYGMVRRKQEEFGMPEFGMTFGNPDFVRLAEAYGASGHRVESAADLGPVLARCLAAEGVHLIEVPITYEVAERKSPPAGVEDEERR